jgi:A/G-specific adenine glycosylase
MPRDLEELRKLPGIGRYTLGAIASIAFGMDVAALDGNIKRVYARIFDVTEPIDSTAGEKLLWQLADENLPRGRAGDYNQALMDLGATICVPKNPRCLICPVMKFCKARQNGTQDRRPVMKPKKEVPHYVHAAGVIIERGRVLLAQRPSKGLLAGMWEFPNGRVSGDPAKGLPNALKKGYQLQVKVNRNPRAEQMDKDGADGAHPQRELGIVEHGYSHFSVTVHVFRCELVLPSKETNLKWVSLKELDSYPMGKIDRQIANMIAR